MQNLICFYFLFLHLANERTPALAICRQTLTKRGCRSIANGLAGGYVELKACTRRKSGGFRPANEHMGRPPSHELSDSSRSTSTAPAYRSASSPGRSEHLSTSCGLIDLPLLSETAPSTK